LKFGVLKSEAENGIALVEGAFIWFDCQMGSLSTTSLIPLAEVVLNALGDDWSRGSAMMFPPSMLIHSKSSSASSTE